MIDKVLFLAELTIQLLSAVMKNNPAAAEQTWVQIIRAGYEGYEAQVGKPIDPSLLKPISPV